MGIINQDGNPQAILNAFQPPGNHLQPFNAIRDRARRQAQGKTGAHSSQDILQVGPANKPGGKLDHLTLHRNLSSKPPEIALDIEGMNIPASPPAITQNLESRLPNLAQKLGPASVLSMDYGKLPMLDARSEIIGKQAGFARKIMIHIGMKIEVIAGEIGKQRAIKIDAAHPLQRQRMGGNFHRRRLDS